MATKIARSVEAQGLAAEGALLLRHVQDGSVPNDDVLKRIQEDVFTEFLSELGADFEPSRRGAEMDDLAGRIEYLLSTLCGRSASES